MSQNDIAVALVGCGGVARRYRKVYTALAGVRVAVAIDADIAEAQVGARETGAERSSACFDDALKPGIDAVVISTPNYLHCEQASQALEAGKHVLLQKPMATSVEECDRILAARAKSNRTLGIYMNLLDHPLFHDLRRIAMEGHLGHIALYSARLAHRGGLKWGGADKNWRASLRATGGGSFVQLGVHYQHFMRWSTGMSVIAIQAMSKNVACPHLEGDDLTLAQYELSGGALGEIQTSWCVDEEHISLLGTKGSIHYRENRRIEFSGELGSFVGESIQLRGDGSSEVIEPCVPPEWDDAQNPYNQHRQFFEALAAGKPTTVSGEDGREDVRLVEACYESARQRRAIS
jgi:predicted dehydrogenase